MSSDYIKKTAAYRFFLFDTFFNWFLGILFIFFHRQLEELISFEPLLPEILWILIGTGLLLFGIWQTYIVLKNGFKKNAQLFSCIMSWLPFLILTYALVFMNFNLFIAARIIIWTGNIYMFVLGLLYFISYRKSIVKNETS